MQVVVAWGRRKPTFPLGIQHVSEPIPVCIRVGRWDGERKNCKTVKLQTADQEKIRKVDPPPPMNTYRKYWCNPQVMTRIFDLRFYLPFCARAPHRTQVCTSSAWVSVYSYTSIFNVVRGFEHSWEIVYVVYVAVLLQRRLSRCLTSKSSQLI